MEYTVNKLAKLSGVSTRTLRYYDEIGLLKPKRINSNGYRIYGSLEVDRLQQILFYRELGMHLDEIGKIISDPNFDKEKALENHLLELLNRKEQIGILIENVTKTISTLKGETSMKDNEKFEGFKQKIVENNEKKYGKEIRDRYGNESINASNAKVKGMTKDQWDRAEKIGELINTILKDAFIENDPASEKAQKVCELHKEWLCMFWKDGMYTKEIHKSLAEGYVMDERFTAYYDKLGEGCTKFLRDAINIYCS